MVVALILVLVVLVGLAVLEQEVLVVAVVAQAVPLVALVVVVGTGIARSGGGRCLTFQYRTLGVLHAPFKSSNRECLRLG